MVKDYFIKNMVCDRCIKVLHEEVSSFGMALLEIELGRLRLDIDMVQEKLFENILSQNGFSLITTKEEKLTEEVKMFLIKMFDTLPLQLNQKLSDYLVNHIRKDYSKISKVFSVTEGITIEKYFIKLKIEKVKELMQLPQFNFTEISQLLDYKHINHLSRQFKAETGMSLTSYREDQRNFRNSLDQII